ncbi:hypothetical protein ACFU6I_41205 [Streptomyces sp. NPDC057486]|uniref:hypothetical protein n=1 Tax=Streptomyces sp. NPDC057486 TaxID=3346145 RepID=UPI0036ADAF48
MHDPGVLRALLAGLNRELEDGDINTEEFEPGRGKAARPAACRAVGPAPSDRR